MAFGSERGSGPNYLLIGQQELDFLLEQPDSLTAPGAAVLELGIMSPQLDFELEQLEAQSLDSLTAPGAAVLDELIGHWAALLEQLEAQSLDSLTAPGEAISLQLLSVEQQEVSVEQQESEVETAPRAALSSVCLLLSQAARTLRSAAAARVVRVRVMVGVSN